MSACLRLNDLEEMHSGKSLKKIAMFETSESDNSVTRQSTTIAEQVK